MKVKISQNITTQPIKEITQKETIQCITKHIEGHSVTLRKKNNRKTLNVFSHSNFVVK